METIHCPYCKCTDDLDYIYHDDNWVDDDNIVSTHDMKCNKCGKMFTLSETSKVVCREYRAYNDPGMCDGDVIEEESDE